MSVILGPLHRHSRERSLCGVNWARMTHPPAVGSQQQVSPQTYHVYPRIPHVKPLSEDGRMELRACKREFANPLPRHPDPPEKSYFDGSTRNPRSCLAGADRPRRKHRPLFPHPVHFFFPAGAATVARPWEKRGSAAKVLADVACPWYPVLAPALPRAARLGIGTGVSAFGGQVWSGNPGGSAAGEVLS